MHSKIYSLQRHMHTLIPCVQGNISSKNPAYIFTNTSSGQSGMQSAASNSTYSTATQELTISGVAWWAVVLHQPSAQQSAGGNC